ncbi:hypothetical protein AVEN_143603-1 [Araneus ventricosus]|uniref:Tc1-like transposase DDE domain-containing protein n=1 Tax=Araneus ventricosus TaxID=182803 RepID=A0A4Y2AQI5_ARAVE|nr:hypothetical protein AVEN_143603-1 [Araneus ventricosus]
MCARSGRSSSQVQDVGGSVMFPGGFSYYDLGPFTAVTTNMNQHVYFNILDDQVLPFSQHLHDEYALVTHIFQDDNSTIHRALKICDRFDEHSHTLMNLDCPVKSPDLNTIENLWDMLEQQVKRRTQHPRNLVDLRHQILSEWLKLDATYLQNLVDSLPNRIQAVIKSRGGVKGIFFWEHFNLQNQTSLRGHLCLAVFSLKDQFCSAWKFWPLGIVPQSSEWPLPILLNGIDYFLLIDLLWKKEKPLWNKSFLLLCGERSSELRPVGSWTLKSFLGLSIADSDSDKEAADMSFDHQRIKLSDQKTLEKMDDIIAHSSITTDDFTRN